MEKTIRNIGYALVLTMSVVLVRALWRAEPIAWLDLVAALWVVSSTLAVAALIDWWKTLPPAWQLPGGDGARPRD